MDVQLRIVHGRLKTGEKQRGVSSFKIRQRRFTIGRDASCHMVCKSRTVSPKHCVLFVDEDGVFVHDLDSRSGTFVNDLPVAGTQEIRPGDTLRFGRLEFEVAIRAPVKASPDSNTEPEADEEPSTRDTMVGSDTVESEISELLLDADDQERQRRFDDPSSRYYRLENQAGRPETDNGPQADETSKKPKRPAKKPVAKLPPPPAITADDSVGAAQKALDEIFHPTKGRSRK